MAHFDDAALSRLTAKLDSKLAQPSNNSGSSPQPNTKKAEAGKKRKQVADDAADAPPSSKRRSKDSKDAKNAPQSRSPSHSKKPRQAPAQPSNAAGPPKPAPSHPSKQTPGDKKGQGHSKKATQGQENGKSERPPSKARPASSKKSLGPAELLAEIKALGGDEDDLKLVEGIADDSDSDAESDPGSKKKAGADPGPDKALQSELAKFAAGLGFDSVTPDDDAEEDEEDVDEEIDSDQDIESEDVEEDSGNAEPPKAPYKGKTIFEPRPDWHAVDLPSLPAPSSDDSTPYLAALTALKAHARSVLDRDSASYSTTRSASSSQKFMSTIMSSGTMSDRISALTLAVQESPVHSVKALETLLGLASKRSRDQALQALAALVDLLGPGSLLPSDRRLRTFTSQLGLVGTLQKHKVKSWSSAQPLPGNITEPHLISWIFEDWLKEAYFGMIQSLETWCNDEVQYSRSKAVDMVFGLLRDKPEQESNLMRLLVNKLGDRERKIASRASYLLLQLLNTHPGMKTILVRTVEQEVLFRPGQDIRAKYYAINTLNQVILSTKEPEISDSLLRIYFAIFVTLLKRGDLDQLDAPSSAPKNPQQNKKQKRRKPGPPDSKRDSPQEGANAGDQEAVDKLVTAILTGINRAVPFSQADHSTLEAHLDTLFRITHSSNFNTSIQALMLIQQLSATRHLATERFYRTLYESLLDPRLITSSKQALYLNLLYRSLKADVDVRRVKAFVKRMLQILNLHQASFVCGVLFLIIELRTLFPDIATLVNEPEEHDFEDGEGDANPDDDGQSDRRPQGAYDGRKRDPEYSNAHRSCLWELMPFLNHFHPSVDVFATGLLGLRKDVKKPELADHTLINFLDKFVYRNAKSGESGKGASIMQPVAAGGQSHVLVSNKKASAKDGAYLNTASFWNRKAEDVAVDDVFFHEYFSRIGKPAQKKGGKDSKADQDSAAGEGSGDEDGEDEIWKALVSSRPEVGGEDESESDGGFDDLMDMDDSEDDGDDLLEGVSDVDDSEMGDEVDEDEEADLDGLGSDEEGAEPELKSAAGEEKKPESKRKARKKALKSLPMFASADDYAEMLAQDDD